MVNSLNFYSEYYYIFGNLSIIAYIIEIKKPKFANVYFSELDQFEPGREIEFCVYFHPVGNTNQG